MSSVFGIALGVVAALGGSLDADELVFNAQAGASFGYQVLWSVVVGTVGIVLYAEMAGRVTTITRRPIAGVVRERMGLTVGLLTLFANEVISVLTVVAQVGGLALVLQLLFFAVPFRVLVVATLVVVAVALWKLPFGAIERGFGYLGVALVVFVVAAVKQHPHWAEAAKGLYPHWQTGEDTLKYWYFIVGVIGAILMPFKLIFYSSGAVEEGWSPDDLTINRANSAIGFGLAGILGIALIMLSAQLFQPEQVEPEFLSTVGLAVQVPLGEVGLIVVAIGMIGSIASGAFESVFASAYNVAQFFGWEYRKDSEPRRFLLTGAVALGLSAIVLLAGADPIVVVEYSVIFGVVALPLSYLSVLLIARDRHYMGEYVNRRATNAVAWAYLALTAVLAIAGPILLFLTVRGKK